MNKLIELLSDWIMFTILLSLGSVSIIIVFLLGNAILKHAGVI